MGREIERKFLVAGDGWKGSDGGSRIRQGYLSIDPDRTVRVRRKGDGAWITIKGRSSGATRAEYEYAIPEADADEMLDTLSIPAVIDKVRHVVRFGGHDWEVDVFEGANAGLVVAELELDSEDQEFERPPWLGEEVTGDGRYANAALVENPYTSWSD